MPIGEYNREYRIDTTPTPQPSRRGQTRHVICSRCKKIMKTDMATIYECPVCRRRMTREQFIRRQQEKGGRRREPMAQVEGQVFHLDDSDYGNIVWQVVDCMAD